MVEGDVETLARLIAAKLEDLAGQS